MAMALSMHAWYSPHACLVLPGVAESGGAGPTVEIMLLIRRPFRSARVTSEILTRSAPEDVNRA